MRSGELAIVVVVSLTVAGLVAREAEPTWHRARNRQELLDIERRLQPGIPLDAALRLARAGGAPHLSVREPASGFVMDTPYEFGARNWILLVDVHDGVVSSIKIRTSDGPKEHPTGAPPDRVLKASVAPMLACAKTAPVEDRAGFPGPIEAVASPSRRFGLRWHPPDSAHDGHRIALAVCDSVAPSETELLSFPRHVDVLWSPSGSRLAVNNHWASDEATVLVWTVLPGEPTDLLAVLKDQEHQRSAAWNAHHLYLEARRWVDEATLELRLSGYGNPGRPALDRRYLYTLGKQFKRVGA